mgnify:CR=1 FL=1
MCSCSSDLSVYHDQALGLQTVVPLLGFENFSSSEIGHISRFVVPLFGMNAEMLMNIIPEEAADARSVARALRKWLEPGRTPIIRQNVARVVPKPGLLMATASPLVAPTGKHLYSDVAHADHDILRRRLYDEVWCAAKTLAQQVRVWLHEKVGVPLSGGRGVGEDMAFLVYGAHLWQTLLLFRELRLPALVELTEEAKSRQRRFASKGLVPEYVFSEKTSVDNDDAVNGGYPGAGAYVCADGVTSQGLDQMLVRTLHRILNLRVSRAFFATEFLTTEQTLAPPVRRAAGSATINHRTSDAIAAARACRQLRASAKVGHAPLCAGVALNSCDAVAMLRKPTNDDGSDKDAQTRLYDDEDDDVDARSRSLEAFLHASRRAEWSIDALRLALEGDGESQRERPVHEAAEDLRRHIEASLPVVLRLTGRRGVGDNIVPVDDASKFATRERRDRIAARFMGEDAARMARWRQARGR